MQKFARVSVGIRLHKKFANVSVRKLLLFLLHNAAAMEPEMTTDFRFRVVITYYAKNVWRISQGTKSQKAKEPGGEKTRGERARGQMSQEGETAKGRKCQNSIKSAFHFVEVGKWGTGLSGWG